MMVVAHNIAAMNTQRQFGINSKSKAKSTEKLSSGYKINRAADDAAGLSISEKMRRQIRGLTQASLNASDGVSMVQTADGALHEVQDMLHRMNELAVKAANGTNSVTDRDYIQSEVDQLIMEIDRVAETTKFNELYLLKGENTTSEALSPYKASAEAMSEILAVEMLNGSTNTQISANRALEVDEARGVITMHMNDTYTRFNDAGFDVANGTNNVLHWHTWVQDGQGGKRAFSVAESVAKDGQSGDFIASSGELFEKISENSLYTMYSSFDEMKEDLIDYYNENTNNAVKDISFTLKNGRYDDKETNSIDLQWYEVRIELNTDGSEKNVPSLEIPLHVGADSGLENKVMVRIESMTAASIGISDLRVDGEDGTNATNSLDIISGAIQKVSAQRSTLGAIQNRLEHTINNLDNIVENTTASEAQIRDTDMAQEMVKFSNDSILEQVGQAMMAQANQSNQGVLQLLQ